jgi:hypothetical protein
VNTFLSSHFSEIVQRLALGLEPIDAASGTRIARPVRIGVDGPPALGPDPPSWPDPDGAAGRPLLGRHGSGRFVLLFSRTVTDSPVRVRIVPRDRRFVPRRMQFDIVDLAGVTASDPDGPDVPLRERTWRPFLFPGAAYDLPETATAIRGTVRENGKRVPWTRVAALAGPNTIGLAHGDDRGEFLLVLGQNLGATGDLVSPLPVTIDVYRRDPAAPPDPNDVPPPAPPDPLVGLPLERAAGPGVAPDDVSTGTLPGGLPASYVPVLHLVDEPVELGRTTSLDFVIP